MVMVLRYVRSSVWLWSEVVITGLLVYRADILERNTILDAHGQVQIEQYIAWRMEPGDARPHVVTWYLAKDLLGISRHGRYYYVTLRKGDALHVVVTPCLTRTATRYDRERMWRDAVRPEDRPLRPSELVLPWQRGAVMAPPKREESPPRRIDRQWMVSIREL